MFVNRIGGDYCGLLVYQLQQWIFHLIDPFASFNVPMLDIFVCDRVRKAEAHDN